MLVERLNMTTPVSVVRLPKGPDPNSRGFDPKSARFVALCRTSISTSTASESDPEELQKEQHARCVLRERFLRCLLAMSNKPVQFHMYENVQVEATFGTSDIDVLNFQVSDLHTPIGVQKEALIRCRDVISFHFDDVDVCADGTAAAIDNFIKEKHVEHKDSDLATLQQEKEPSSRTFFGTEAEADAASEEVYGLDLG